MPTGTQKPEPAGVASGKDNLFLWTVFLLLLAGIGFACWLGSFYIFGHPEQPRSYRILSRLGKISAPVRFPVTKAPPGKFLGAQAVFEKYSVFTTLQLEHENELLIRNYIKNYTETNHLVPYLTGKYTILKTYELQATDLITSGVVALGQSEEFPQLLVELIYPTPSQNVAELKQLLQPGLEVRLEKTLDLSAILHVGHALDGRLQITTMPLLYGSYALKNGVGTFSLEPPTSLNVGAGFPMVRGEEVRSVMREQLELKRKRLASKQPQSIDGASNLQLVRLDVDNTGAGVPSVGPLPMPPPPPKAETVELAGNAGGGSVPGAVIRAGSSESVAVVKESLPVKDLPASKQTINSTILAAGSGASVGEGLAVNTGSVSGKSVGGGKDLGKGKGAAAATASAVLPTTNGVPNPPVASTVSTTKGPTKSDGAKGESLKTESTPLPVKPEASVTKAEVIAQGVPKPAPVAPVSSVKSAGKQGGVNPVPPPSVSIVANNTPVANGANPPQFGAGAVGGNTGLPVTKAEPKPFIAATPAAVPTGPTGSWKTYGAGQQPGGRVVSTEQATELAGRNDAGRLYLRGQFVVTATGNNRAVLRQARSDDRSPPARVIVEYPAGAVPPSQGSSIARDDGRGFEIREVRKSADGQINIFVREVNAP